MGQKEREAEAEPSLTRTRERLSDPGGSIHGVDHRHEGVLLQLSICSTSEHARALRRNSYAVALIAPLALSLTPEC